MYTLGPMAAGGWVLKCCANERFPFRLRIERAVNPRLILHAQDRWSGANRNIFLLRDGEPGADVLEELERVPIVTLQQRGRSIENQATRGSQIAEVPRAYAHDVGARGASPPGRAARSGPRE